MRTSSQQRHRYFCTTCKRSRLHEVRRVKADGKRQSVWVRVCACTTKTPLAPAEVPGVSCPKCGNRWWRQVYTRHPDPGVTIRRKACRVCDHQIMAKETFF